MCGEHTGPAPCRASYCGSSPRVRGTRRPVHRRTPRPRFIPACAGNTAPARILIPPRAVHPRVCGEHCVCHCPTFTVTGSSPRVRGTPGRRPRSPPPLRFIPACAGNTHDAEGRAASHHGSSPRVRGTPLDSPAPRCRRPVHPRVCGEHGDVRHGVEVIIGSSPRVRGTRFQGRRGRRRQRFIPACAGNTG